jgi:YD repeat-containing protein
MVDFYGVAWTYYFDRAGRIIRQVNNGTQATRSVNYDAAGQVDGVEAGGRRACFHYDEYGNVLDVFDFPRPGAMGRQDPIRYRYSWKVNP